MKHPIEKAREIMERVNDNWSYDSETSGEQTWTEEGIQIVLKKEISTKHYKIVVTTTKGDIVAMTEEEAYRMWDAPRAVHEWRGKRTTEWSSDME